MNSSLARRYAKRRVIVQTTLRRSRRRAVSRGATMFIVSMTIGIIASLGLYALRIALTEVKASGYERQSAQTHYLTEYGVLGATEIFNSTTAQEITTMMEKVPDAACVSLTGVPSTASPRSLSCRRMGSAEMSGIGGWATAVLNPWTSASVPGSLGSAPLNGGFFVEFTDPLESKPPPGFDLALGLCFELVTVSSYGEIYPIVSTTAGTYGNLGMEAARARILGGPIRCQK